MRDFKGMKRQRGRNRGGGGGGGGGKPQQNANRAFESNGPDNLKIRGHAQHVFEKYQQLARDATSSGDRVLAENFLQHAEHYFRLLRTLQPNRPYTDFVSREGFVSGYDIDFEDDGAGEGEEAEAASEGSEGSSGEERDYREAPRDGGFRNDNRDGGYRNDTREGGYRNEARNDRSEPPRGDRVDTRNDRGGFQNRNGRFRDDRPFNRERNEAWRNENRGEGRAEGRSEGRSESRPEAPRSDRGEARDGREPRESRPESRDDGRGQGRYDARPDRGEASEAETRGDRDRFERPARSNYERSEPVIEAKPAPEPLPAEPVVDARDGAADRVLRSRDGDVSHTPAFLQGAAPTAPAAEELPVKRPRGRPRKKVVVEGEGGSTDEA